MEEERKIVKAIRLDKEQWKIFKSKYQKKADSRIRELMEIDLHSR